MEENETELKFNQLITKIIIGRFTFEEMRDRIIFLSKGILIAEKDAIYFYEYERYSKKFIMLLNEKDKKNFRFSKLLNDKFCIYSPGETKIYQFNNKDFTATLVKKINVNLKNLIEMDDGIFINITENYFHIWKKLQSIYKWDQMSFATLIIVLNLLILLCLRWLHLEEHLLNKIYFMTAIIRFIIIKFIINLFNPYKRIKYRYVYQLEKFGKDRCFLVSIDFSGIYDYKKYKIIKKINMLPFFATFFIINEDIIIFTEEINKRCEIYNTSLNKIIKEIFPEFFINYHNTFKVGKNLFITCYKNSLIKWKYNFEINNINILNRNNFKCEENILVKNIINNKLFIFTEKFCNNLEYTLSAYIYK